MSDDQRPPDDSTRTDGKLAPDAARTGTQKQPDSVTGKQLGDFELLRELGRGGMGIVYEARQVSLNRRVALKVLPPGLGLTDTAIQRFEREARAAAKLHHTNIVPVHAIGEEEGCHYYAMELVEGEPLSRVINDLRGHGSNPLMEAAVTQTVTAAPAKEKEKAAAPTTGAPTSLSDTSSSSREWFDTVARLLADVADALHYAHGRGVIHRDVKPANLMLSNDGRLCLSDFGLARVTQEPGMTVSGSFLGTPAYMSPEQIAAGRVKLDHRSDVYSLGAVLYEMLSLRRPFTGESRDEILNAIMTKDPRPPRRYNPRIPIDLETICQTAMEKDRDRRYQSAADFANDLRQYLQHGLIAARRAGLVRRTWKSIRRHPVAATVVVAVLIVVAITGIAWRISADRAAQEIDRHLAEARFALARGRDREALRSADLVLATAPGQDEARAIRARALLATGRGKEAVAEARVALEKNPDDWLSHVILLHGWWDSDETVGDEREPHVEAVERLAPDTAEAYTVRAMITDSAEEKVRLLDRALDLDPGDADALSMRGWSQITLKNFPAAMADADRLISARPLSAWGRHLKAWCYYYLHDRERALAEANRAIEVDPEDAGSFDLRKDIYADMFSDEEKAMADISTAIEMDPENPYYYQGRAYLHSSAGRHQEALADMQRSLELDPEDYWSIIRMIWMHLEMDEREEVMKLMEEAAKLSEGWSDPEMKASHHSSRSSVFFRLDDLARSVAEIEMAIELDPDEWWYYLRRARFRTITGDDAGADADCDHAAGVVLTEPAELRGRSRALSSSCDRKERAIEDLTRAIEMAPHWADAYRDRAIQYLYMGDFDRALSDLDRCIELADHWPICYRTRGILNARLGQYEDALRDEETRTRLTPKSYEAYYVHADTLREVGRLDEAERMIDKAIELAPDVSMNYLARASTLMFQEGQCHRVAADIRRARELDPSGIDTSWMVAAMHSWSLYYRCSELYDLETALTSAKQALRWNPNDYVARSALGIALYRQGKYEEAIEYQLEAAAAFSDNALQLFHLAMQHWQLGRKAEARAYYERAVRWMDEHNPNGPVLIPMRDEAAELLGIQP